MNRIPKKIGKYPILAKLAEGGMGAVFKAEHPTLNRTVIIKKLTLIDNPALEERFRREANIMMDFREEHIVQVYDHFKDRGSYYIVMEYVEGIDLHHLLREKRYLPNHIALLIFSEICKALQYAHEHKVIHRDIKPGNILISSSGEVKLTDFGIATTMEDEDQLTGAGMALGTPAYMAPEQITDSRNVDQRADIYSMGVMLYEMVTGQKPFRGGFTPEVIAKVGKGDYRPPRKLNSKVLPSVQKLIKKAMHHKLKRRYLGVERVLERCDRFLKGYDDQKTIADVIQRYVNGEEMAGLAQKRIVTLRSRIRFFLRAVFILLLGLGLGSFWAYQKGIHYEYLYPEQFGALSLEVKVRRGGKPKAHKFMQASLFTQINGKWQAVTNSSFRFQEDAPFHQKEFYRFRSQKIYLLEGNYRIFLHVENEQYQETFYLPSRLIQRQQKGIQSEKQIRFAIEANAPSVPLKLNYTVRRLPGNQNITEKSQLFIYHNKGWEEWQKMSQDEDFLKTFTTGKNYSFKVQAEGYHTKFANLSVSAEQTVANLEISLLPLSGNLSIRANLSNLEILINNLPYYLEGRKSTVYRKFQPLSKNVQKISLPAGDYFLTIRDKKTWLERISWFPPRFSPLRSKTQKIEIRPGKNLKILAKLSFQQDSLELNTE